MEKLINNWKLNKGVLAKRMGMPLGTFCNKLSSKHNTQFSDSELIQLKMILKELQNDICNEVDVDFNDALKMIVKANK